MTTTAPAPPEVEAEDRHTRLYWAIAFGVVALAVIGLITFGAHKSDQVAQQKAQELSRNFAAAGLPVPADQDAIVRQLGSEGGYVCADPGSALGRALLFDQITNGGSFVGRRPVIGDTQILKGELLILQTYCPDKVPQFQDRIGNLKTDDTVKD
jgi:hypothetical protein